MKERLKRLNTIIRYLYDRGSNNEKINEAKRKCQAMIRNENN